MVIEALTLLFLGIFIGISQSAGIGGGTIINVLLMTGFGIDAKESIPISYLFLIGGGLASTIANSSKILKDGKPALHTDLVMITLPMMMTGAIFGTIINHFISQLVISILFLILILYLTYNVVLKLLESLKETEQIPYAAVNTNGMSRVQQLRENNIVQNNGRLEQIIKEERQLITMNKCIIVAIIYIYTVVILLCRGGKSYDSFIGIQRCGFWSWVFVFLHFGFSLMASMYIGLKLQNKDLQKQSLGYIFQNENAKYNSQKLKFSMMTGFLAGFLGGAVSIGGGMVLVPIWIKLGIDKNIAAGSTGPLIFFSSTVSFFIELLLGSYSSALTICLYILLAFVGSYSIKNLVNYLTDKYNLKQMIFYLLLFMMAASMLALVPVQISKYNEDKTKFMRFGILC